MLTYQYPRLENLFQLTLSVSVNRGLPHHLTAEHSDDDLRFFRKSFGS